jgi:hypothetical protein
MFELIVFAEVLQAERALKNSAALLPNASIALDTIAVLQWALARMGGQTLLRVTYPRLAIIADGPLVDSSVRIRIRPKELTLPRAEGLLRARRRA